MTIDLKQKKQNNKLDMKNVLKLMMKVSLPSLISNIIMSFYHIIDTKFVGMLGDEALAAMSIIYPINVFIYAISIGLGIGTISVISKYLGEKDIDNANTIAGNVLIIAAIYSVIFTLIGMFYTKYLISFVSSGSLIIDGYAEQYIKVILLGSCGIFLPSIISDILKGEGNSFSPMLALLFGAILNIILDPILIFGYGSIPAMGISGAAWSTTLSRLISGIMSFVILFKKENVIRPKLTNLKKLWPTIKHVYYFGTSTMVATIIVSTSIFFVNLMVSKHSIAALSFTGVMITFADAIVFLPIYGLAQGFLPIAVYSYGQKDYTKLFTVSKYALLISSIISVVGGIIFITFPRAILSSFIKDEEVITMGVYAFRIIGISHIFAGPTIISAALLQSIGRSSHLAMVAFMRSILIFIPLAYFIGMKLGLIGVWIAFPLTEVFVLFFALFWLHKHMKDIKGFSLLSFVKINNK